MYSFPYDPERIRLIERRAREARGKYVRRLLRRAFHQISTLLRSRPPQPAAASQAVAADDLDLAIAPQIEPRSGPAQRAAA